MNLIGYTIPEWLEQKENQLRGTRFDTIESRVLLAVELSEENIAHGGGPFGAAVFSEQGEVVSLGVNLVTLSGFSVAHAEIVAIMAAQKQMNTYDLSPFRMELAASCEPCVMCHGATQWSGIVSLLFGATKEDAESIGFDEGDKHDNWRELLENRGISVHGPLEREKAARVLFNYKNSGGVIYNADGN